MPFSKNQSYFHAWCDMEGPNGGWILLQERNLINAVNFYRDWVSYEKGFGKPGVGYWVGNSYMHAITLNRRHVLRIEVPSYPWVFTEYDNFIVSSSSTNYVLHLGKSRGTAGDLLSKARNSAFSTWDRDNDKVGGACAIRNKGAWWYGDTCYAQDLNSMLGSISIAMKAKELLEGNYFICSLKL